VTGYRRGFWAGLSAWLAAALAATGLTAAGGPATAAAASGPPTVNLQVLLIGEGSADPTTAAWQAALTSEGVPYTLITASGSAPSETVNLPALSSGGTGNFNGVVIADSPADYAPGQLAALDAYESSFGVRQVDGYMYPSPALGVTDATGGALDGTTATLTAAGQAAFPALKGPVTFDAGTYGYGATVDAGAPYTPFLTDASGNVMAGVYQHPAGDPQAGVAELALNFDYNANQMQWLLLAPGLINWMTQDAHLGLDRNYVEMDIDDTFTPDNAWSVTLHDNDYSDADSLRMEPPDVISAADWSNPAQENTPGARPAGEPSTPFRMDQLFNYGGSVEYQDGALDLPGEPAACDTPNPGDDGTCGPDPLLAQFQATDPATGQPYADDFGWLSHTYDTPYLDVGCATKDYIEAELNENTSDVTGAPGTTPGTGGLGLPKRTIPAGSIDVTHPYGTYDPQVFVPGNHSGLADLDPGTPATVDPPDLDAAYASASGGSLPEGTYEYAVTDQFNGSDPTSTDQSQAYVTDGQQGDLPPVTVTGSTGAVSLVWQAICHAANYVIYRAPVSASGTVGNWTEIGTYATPDSATLPDNSSGDSSPPSTKAVCLGPSPNPTSCGGEKELTFTDTGSSGSPPPAGVTYLDTPMPAGWTPPVVENANEQPWEQNPYFTAALSAAGINTVGADASKPYPDPPDAQFGIGASYSGPTYAAGQPFVDGSAQAAPRHPINIFYNAATNAQELDEYNTLFDADYPDSQCHDTATTTCSTTPFTFTQVIDQVVSGMMANLLSNNPEISYVHQTNIMGTPPYPGVLPPANYVPAATSQPGTDGDGLLYEVLNPLIAEYDGYFNGNTPYVQLTLGGVGNTLADQTAWASALGGSSPTVTASETGGVVTVSNSGTGAVNVPVTMPPGTTTGGAASLQSYGGALSNWVSMPGGSSATFTENAAPAITGAASAGSTVGTAFSFTVTTTGAPAPALTETGALPSGVTFTDNGDGTATIAGTPAAGSGGSYPIQITAKNPAGSVSSTFTLTNDEAPSIVSPPTTTFAPAVASKYTVTTRGYPAPALTESGPLPGGLSFTDNGNGTATISGTPASGTNGSYPVTVSASNATGSTATQTLTITVQAAAAPAITSGNIAFFSAGQAGAAAVTTTGSPASAITETGGLPGGLSFTDDGNGTALISGTANVTGTASLGVRASNGINPDATQPYTVIVGRSPSFTSSGSATATLGSAFSFTVKAGGYPAPSWGESGLPPGVSFTDNGDGTATLSGTPTTAGTYAMPLMATNAYGSAQQTLTVTVQQAPAITSGRTANFTVGTPENFSVQTTGSPTASITESGALPSGVSFTDNGDGTATLAGTPASGTSGSYPLTITAANGDSPAATQSLTLNVNPASPAAPAINSGGSAAFTVGTQGSFSVLTTGDPTASITESGALPSGVSFTDNGDGTATLAGTPASGTSGSYPLTITAANGDSPAATQSFTLTVGPATAAPVITSGGAATFAAGQQGSFTVTATGLPTPALSATSSPALPSGVSFTDNGDGTATLSGTPPAGSQGSYLLTIHAASPAGTASQSFLLTVDSGLAITSAASDAVTAGSAFSFKVTTAGTAAPALNRSGGLPAGVTFTDNGDGTGTLSGTPAVTGSFPLTFTAKNSGGTASQAFLLTVAGAPAFSAATVKETLGLAFTAVVRAGGFPAPKLSATGLPAGVSFSDDGDGAGTFSGTAAVGPGTYPVSVTAANAAGTATHTITLSVKAPGSQAPVPAFTSAAAASAAAGQALDLTFTTAGSPTGYTANITRNGALPSGVVFTNNANGTATLTGTPSASSGGSYPITLSAQTAGGVTTQAFVLTVTAGPAIITGISATATVGSGFNFTLQARGAPAPTLTETGALPQGLTWTDNGNGTASLAGAPGVAQGGVYKLTFTATNFYGTTTQSFTLTVDQAPGILTAPAATASVGKPFSFTFAAAGYPVPAISHGGSVPGLKFGSSSDGALTLSGTPSAAGTYDLTITAKNSLGSVTQAFTLTAS
jgi:hypothetical protein